MDNLKQALHEQDCFKNYQELKAKIPSAQKTEQNGVITRNEKSKGENSITTFGRKKNKTGRKNVPSVQHRLQDALNRPINEELVNRNLQKELEVSYNLTEKFENLKIEIADDSTLPLIKGDINNEPLFSSTPNSDKNLLMQLPFSQVRRGRLAETYDEIFLRLSRGIQILPECKSRGSVLVTPLCPNNEKLKEEMDKYCVIPKPWCFHDLKSLPKCICFRKVEESICLNCGHIMKGRVYKNCERHPRISFLYDYFFCVQCHAETEQLKEL